MSSAPDILLLARPGDPAATPLALWLGRDGANIRLQTTPGSISAGQTVWYADHIAFLLHAAAARDVAPPCNLILRPGLDDGRQLQTVALAISFAQKLFDDRVVFWALSDASAQMIATTQGLSVNTLTEAVPETPPGLPVMDLSVSAGLLRSEGGAKIGIPLKAANLARISRRYRLHCSDPEPAEGMDLIAIAESATIGRPDRRNRVLFIVPGGAGLGHMSRCLAIAEALSGVDCDFLVYNDAAYLAADAGHRVYHRQSAAQLNADSDTWRRWETAALTAYLAAERPAAVIVDASHIDPYIVEALSHRGAESTQLIWIRREMWRADRQVAWGGNEAFTDLVIVPGELLQSEPPQRPERPPCHDIAPIVLKATRPNRTRKQMRRALGLKRGPACLVSLGAWTSAVSPEIIAKAAGQASVQLIWAQSPLASSTNSPDGSGGHLYPLAGYLEAFDGVISAAGYNSFHELMFGFSGPVLFVPVDQRGLDDQVARARFAAQSGLAEMLEPDTALASLTTFFETLRKGASRRPASRQSNGATEAADLIARCIAPYQDGSDA